MARSSGFEKDLGYLFPFLDRVERSASDMEPAAAERLRGLVQGERERWSAIRDLLQNRPVAPPSTRPPAASPVVSGGWTVGDLKRR